MPKHTLKTDLLPGRARVVVQLYEAPRRRYVQPAGFSRASILVENPREAARLWAEINDVITAARWSDAGRRAQATAPAAAIG